MFLFSEAERMHADDRITLMSKERVKVKEGEYLLLARMVD